MYSVLAWQKQLFFYFLGFFGGGGRKELELVYFPAALSS